MAQFEGGRRAILNRSGCSRNNQNCRLSFGHTTNRKVSSNFILFGQVFTSIAFTITKYQRNQEPNGEFMKNAKLKLSLVLSATAILIPICAHASARPIGRMSRPVASPIDQPSAAARRGRARWNGKDISPLPTCKIAPIGWSVAWRCWAHGSGIDKRVGSSEMNGCHGCTGFGTRPF